MSQSEVDRSAKDLQAGVTPQNATKTDLKPKTKTTGRELSDTELDRVAGAGVRRDTDP